MRYIHVLSKSTMESFKFVWANFQFSIFFFKDSLGYNFMCFYL